MFGEAGRFHPDAKTQAIPVDAAGEASRLAVETAP